MITASWLPEPETDAVVAWLLGSGLRSCLDVTGRPLGEQASPRYAAVPQREEHRTFGDARDQSGLPCNVAALAQLHGTWPTLLAALSGLHAEQPETAARTFARISAGLRLAPLQALRTQAPVPVVSAALHKAMLGFGDLCAAMLLEERVDADQPTPGGDVLAGWLAERPWLIGQAQVCAGSRGQITRCWQALGDSGAEQPVGDLDAPWFRSALAALLELETLAAAGAGVARVARLGGLSAGPVCAALLESGEVPLLCEALRQAPSAGPMHPTLLFPSDQVPASLRGFIEGVGQEHAAAGVHVTDDVLLRAAADPAERLMRALGLSPTPLTTAAFLESCGPGVPVT